MAGASSSSVLVSVMVSDDSLLLLLLRLDEIELKLDRIMEELRIPTAIGNSVRQGNPPRTDDPKKQIFGVRRQFWGRVNATLPATSTVNFLRPLAVMRADRLPTAACLSSLTVPPRAMSGLSRSWCSSASISPFAISCGRGADCP